MLKRLIICCLGFLLSAPDSGAQIYVSPQGNDVNSGAKEKPLATVAMALRKARELRRLEDNSISTGIHIYVGEGIYRFEESLFIRPEDAGTAVSPTTIEALPGTNPVFSGGTSIKGWKKLSASVNGLPKMATGKVWVADAPVVGNDVIDFRQMWINNKKAVRARDKNDGSMNRILSWNSRMQQCWIPKPSAAISNVAGMEFTIHQWWAIANLRIKSALVNGDSVLLSFYQPESRIQSEHPWPAPWISSETGNSAFYLSNAIQFLDSPGEWYLDKKNRKIYYWPRDGENMLTTDVVAPVLENLLNVEGTLDSKVSHIQFKGISFQHSSWLRPSKLGHVPLQAGMFLLDAYKLKVPGTPGKKTLENQAWVGRPGAAVIITNASDISFENCRFEHLASTGLDFNKGSQNCSVVGNIFKDVGGTAILAGVFSEEAMEAHLPYQPKDQREICENISISNNLINDAANEDWGCVGVGVGFARNVTISHNDISEVPYSGVSLGWGWTETENVMRNNKVMANRITHYASQLYDVAAIYTLSAQPGTVISGNYIDSIYRAPYAHLPQHWFYLYTDEGSAGITIKDNWTPSKKYLQNANGPGNVWENNGPTVNNSIRQSAGLETAYKHLLKAKPSVDKNKQINHELPVIIELISQDKTAIDISNLKRILAENQVATDGIYQWENHTVLFERVKDAFVLKNKIAKEFPGTQIKVYYDAFYEFNRKLCSDTSTATEWDHILLTANVVKDERKQQEYMNYHATQFEKWPEVSGGFCNASFQQLLLYRNGRQLMLVISIPKGQSLDQLNPKTTENNPRVNDWNALMKNYQEGIEGTKAGETWVFLRKI